MTFTDLRRAMTPPTFDQIAEAFREELVALANEHAPRDVTAPWWGVKAEAADAALTVAIMLRPAGPERELLEALRQVERTEERAVWGCDPEAFADATAELSARVRAYVRGAA